MFYQFFNQVIIAFIEGVLIIFLFIVLNDKKEFLRKNLIRAILFCILYTIISYWSSAYIPFALHTVFIIVLTSMILSYITKVNLYASGLTVVIFLLILVMTESPIFSLFIILFKLDYKDLIENNTVLAIISIVCKAVQFLLIFLLYKIKVAKLTYINILRKENSFIAYYLLQLAIISLCIFSVNYAVSSISNLRIYNVLLFLILTAFSVLWILDYKERERVLKAQQKLIAQEEYVKQMESFINILRREKHDMSNHLNTINAMCTLGKDGTLGKIRKYISNLSNNITSSYKSFNTGNDYLDGLLSLKYNQALASDIEFEVEIRNGLEKLKMESYELISIISNILDNGFEAIKQSNNTTNKKVILIAYESEKFYCIEISNNGPMIPQQLFSKIFESGFSTKKSKTERGYGLYIVKQLVSKYNGTITLNSTDEKTSFVIELPQER